MNPGSIIGILLACSVVLLIRAEFKQNMSQRFVLKPVSMLLIILLAAVSLTAAPQAEFKRLVLIGLIVCFGGDLALMFESNRAFLAGLIFFLSGHIVYAGTFWYFNGFISRSFLISGILLVLGLSTFAFMFSSLNQLKIPVLIYILAISLMVNNAAMSFFGPAFNRNQALLLTSGAILFYISDAMLAINKFKIPFRYNRISLVFYFAGQYLIALSTHFA